jgi:hypothetical protein
MASFELPVLGPTEFAPSEDGRWEVRLGLPAGPVRIDFNVDGQEMTADLIRRTERYLADLANFDRLARAALRDDYEKGEAGRAQEYLTFHLEEARTTEERVRWFGPDDPCTMGAGHLLAALNLYRVGLRPEEPDEIAVFDYTIGWPYHNEEGRYIVETDQILCVYFNAEGKVVTVSWES